MHKFPGTLLAGLVLLVVSLILIMAVGSRGGMAPLEMILALRAHFTPERTAPQPLDTPAVSASKVPLWQGRARFSFAQMIRVKHGVLNPPSSTMADIARSVPGSLWLVGNEPDGATWQDDATPVQYATAYHQAYRAIKQADPTALVAIVEVIQPTLLRLRYLDAVLAAYQQLYGEPMPVDE